MGTWLVVAVFGVWCAEGLRPRKLSVSPVRLQRASALAHERLSSHVSASPSIALAEVWCLYHGT